MFPASAKRSCLGARAVRRPPSYVLARRLNFFFFFLFVTYGAFLPFFPTWLRERGVRGVAMSAIMALGPALGVIGPPAFGALSDWLGLRTGLLRMATAGGLVAMLLIAGPTALGHAPGIGLLFVAMLIFSTSRAPSVAMADVIAVEATRTSIESGAPRSYGSFRLWGSIGFLLAAAGIGRVIDVRGPLHLPAFLALSSGVTFALSFALSAPAPPRATNLTSQMGRVLQDRGFVRLLVATFLGFGAHVSYDICFSLHLQTLGLDASWVGAAWAIGVVAEVGMMALSGRLLARFSGSQLLVTAFVGGALRWALIAFVPSVPVLLALQPLHAISFALFWVTALDVVKRRAPPAILATAQGVFNAALGSGAVVFMFAWGALYEAKGGRATFAGAAVVALLAAIVSVGVARSAARASAAEVV